MISPAVTWTEVRAFIEAIQKHPSYRPDVRAMTSPVNSFLALCQTSGAVRNKVSDAYIAAAAIDHDASIATWDPDFSAFPVPLVPAPGA